MIQAIKDSITHWYFRYLLVTNLYMAEKWERIFFHIFFPCVILIVWYINSRIVLVFAKLVVSAVVSIFDNNAKQNMDTVIITSSSEEMDFFSRTEDNSLFEEL